MSDQLCCCPSVFLILFVAGQLFRFCNITCTVLGPSSSYTSPVATSRIALASTRRCVCCPTRVPARRTLALLQVTRTVAPRSARLSLASENYLAGPQANLKWLKKLEASGCCHPLQSERHAITFIAERRRSDTSLAGGQWISGALFWQSVRQAHKLEKWT